MKPTSDTAAFLESLLWSYPKDENGENPHEQKTIYDFSDEFTEGVETFCKDFREYLYLGDVPVQTYGRSFGANVYLSLSGHGIGFWDDDETAHLQKHLEDFAISNYQFENIDLIEDENGNLDLSILPEYITAARAALFRHN